MTTEGLEWMDDALCREIGPELFFPPDEQTNVDYTDARKVCMRCEVRDACLDYAVTERITHGMWGGETPRDREIAYWFRKRRAA